MCWLDNKDKSLARIQVLPHSLVHRFMHQFIVPACVAAASTVSMLVLVFAVSKML